MWKIAIVLFPVLLSRYCFSQFNDTTNYYVNLASTGILSKTNNSNSYLLNNSFRFSVYRKRVSANSTSGFIYGEQQDKLANRDFSSSLDFNVYSKPQRSIYLWGLGNYETSFSLKIDKRIQAGLGLGYTILDRENGMIVISDGILYEKSVLRKEDAEGGGDQEYETFRNSFRIRFRFLIRERIVIESTDFLQQALSDRRDYIIRSQTSFSLKLMRWLSFTTSVTYNKLGLTQNENLLINFGLTLERYF